MKNKADNKPLVALGVTGCIGAYKSAELLRRLQDSDVDVQPVMTDSARQFISPLTLSTLSGRETITSLWREGGDWDVKHISLSDSMSALVVAPATANSIAKFAVGLADDFLSTLYLATERPVLIAPAMNAKMWRHQATQENIAVLKDRGVQFVQPGTGWLACGWEGEGRLAAIEDIVDATGYVLRAEKSLAGKRFLITTGPTAEDIDPMRFITNRSSGSMGIELARAAKARGAQVTIIAGPVTTRMPYGVEVVNVRSAAGMNSAVMSRLDRSDVLCMVAAVADYTPVEPSEQKLKKSESNMSLELERTVDILATVGAMKERPFLIGFAAESQNVLDYARGKLKSKKADMIVGNLISGPESVVGTADTAGIIIAADGEETEVPRCSKQRMADMILDAVEMRLK
jgi:phosphopantothenoylcysteine decarboxylase/phosphopantothenate--cysteine ligase